jgi:hypothetical protein
MMTMIGRGRLQGSTTNVPHNSTHLHTHRLERVMKDTHVHGLFVGFGSSPSRFLSSAIASQSND